MSKLYWTLREIARESHLKLFVVRFWCDYFGYGTKRSGTATAGAGSIRYVTAAERTMLRRIKKLSRMGYYTLEGIKHQLKRQTKPKDL